jgi:hypothetical protein
MVDDGALLPHHKSTFLANVAMHKRWRVWVKGGHAEQVAAAAGSPRKAALLAGSRGFDLGSEADQATCTIRGARHADVFQLGRPRKILPIRTSVRIP